jgi:asparagine synthase (glutamine-hydrolysing)
VAALAASQVKVVLTGDGGDEIFGGYNYWWYVEPQLQWQSLRKLDMRGAKNFSKSLLDWSQYLLRGADHWHNCAPFFRRRYSTGRALNLLGTDLVESIKYYNPQWVYHKYRESALDPFRQAQWFDIKYSLPSQMLVKVDRATMHHSLEARSPFLSHHLVETMLNMATAVRNPAENWFKGLFRTWLADKVPQSVLNAPKRGFGAPLHWQPVNRDLQPEQAKLKRCIEASIVRPAAMPKIQHDPKIYWIFLQIERALKEGLF